jgi:hypothetical protein
LVIIILASQWVIFRKAGRPGWACLIPFYNIYVLLQVAGKPGWWLILMFIPLVNLIIAIITMFGLAENFGKSGAFAVGLILLSIVFFPILAFGSSEYIGEAGAQPVRVEAEKPVRKTADVTCPLCGSATSIRKANKGPNAGKSFHVCVRFPDCKGKVPV